MFLVAGLGNPGREYADNRHNIGFLVVDALAQRWRAGTWKQKFGAEVVQGEFAGERVLLMKPQEYMNLSGPVVQRGAAFYQAAAPSLICVHDDIDLEFGRLKIKVGGGHGGHNGVRSIAEHIGPAFMRVRCGVGHPGRKDKVVGHVLQPFSKAEQKELPFLVDAATEAVEIILRDGVVAAMNKFNQVPASGKDSDDTGKVPRS